MGPLKQTQHALVAHLQNVQWWFPGGPLQSVYALSIFALHFFLLLDDDFNDAHEVWAGGSKETQSNCLANIELWVNI